VILPQDRVSLQAPAKVNLYLKVTGRREDGYHYLATLMQKISLFDRIDLKREQSGIRLCCPDSDLPEDRANLAFRATELFLERMGGRVQGGKTGVTLTLSKTIPVAAGLGGGSSDAAAVLRGLDQLFATGCREDELLDMGALLGADVPFFVAHRPVAWALGIGDQLHPAVPLSGYRILIVNPGYSVSTPWVYEKFALTDGQNINNLKNLQNQDVGRDRQQAFSSRAIRPDELVNDLEQVTSSHYREIELLKKRLVTGGAVAAMMSGSGPTVFGLFQASEAERAVVCAQELKREYQKTYLVDPLQA
jgi:4-diphosphocytidyl-2-C-methyl-D-erythritol kinase